MTFKQTDAADPARSENGKLDRRQFITGSAAVAVGSALAATASGNSSQAVAGRSDRIVIDGLDPSDMTDEFLGLLRKGGVHCSHVTLEDAYQYGAFLTFVDQHSKDVTVAKSVEQILKAKAEGKIAFICGSQAASLYMPKLFANDPAQKNSTIANALRTNYELGMRTQGICYNLASIFGGGCLEPRSPLTRQGHRLVEEIHKLRLVLDVGGHTGEQTSLDAIAMSSGVPVVCTHTNAAAINPNPRATSDRVLEAIAKTGGVIGVTAISDFHTRNANSMAQVGPRSPQATLDMHLDHYDYIKRLVGVEHVALGPDFIWGHDLKTYVHSNADNMWFPSDAMSDGPSQLVKDFENISMLSNVERGLAKRGWTTAELDKLMGANWLRVYKSVWGG